MDHLPCPDVRRLSDSRPIIGGTLYAAADAGDRTPDLGFGCLAAVVGDACTGQTQGGVYVQFSQIHHLANHQPSVRAVATLSGRNANEALRSAFDALNGQEVNGRAILVKSLGKTTEVDQCHVYYLRQGRAGGLKNLIEANPGC